MQGVQQASLNRRSTWTSPSLRQHGQESSGGGLVQFQQRLQHSKTNTKSREALVPVTLQRQLERKCHSNAPECWTNSKISSVPVREGSQCRDEESMLGLKPTTKCQKPRRRRSWNPLESGCAPKSRMAEYVAASGCGAWDVTESEAFNSYQNHMSVTWCPNAGEKLVATKEANSATATVVTRPLHAESETCGGNRVSEVYNESTPSMLTRWINVYMADLHVNKPGEVKVQSETGYARQSA